MKGETFSEDGNEKIDWELLLHIGYDYNFIQVCGPKPPLLFLFHFFLFESDRSTA